MSKIAIDKLTPGKWPRIVNFPCFLLSKCQKTFKIVHFGKKTQYIMSQISHFGAIFTSTFGKTGQF